MDHKRLNTNSNLFFLFKNSHPKNKIKSKISKSKLSTPLKKIGVENVKLK